MTTGAARPEWRDLERKLVAILRGIRPEETAETVRGLLDAGFQAVEVPLNSPDPFRSIEIAVRIKQEVATAPTLIGAGTVLTPDDARRVADIGGDVVVAPNTDGQVIRAARAAGLQALPGCFTATEALTALQAGASALKFFPASLLGPAGIKAIRAILPPDAGLCAVGGVSDADFADYLAVGVEGFGLGSSLYKPGDAPAEVIARGRRAVEAYDSAVQKPA